MSNVSNILLKSVLGIIPYKAFRETVTGSKKYKKHDQGTKTKLYNKDLKKLRNFNFERRRQVYYHIFPQISEGLSYIRPQPTLYHSRTQNNDFKLQE